MRWKRLPVDCWFSLAPPVPNNLAAALAAAPVYIPGRSELLRSCSFSKDAFSSPISRLALLYRTPRDIPTVPTES